MNHKVLLADDSLTIQKVIKITLANQPYDIVECSNDDDLFRLLPQVQPKLVFLDFNLSEKFTGYELTSKIKAAAPGAKVLLLLGTFDSVDDAAMEKCGASDKVVKPFDSNKFISICKRLAESEVTVEETEQISPTLGEKTDKFVLPADEDQWKVNHKLEERPVPAAVPEKFDSSKPDALTQNLADWGMNVPGVIGSQSSDRSEFPPVIGEVKPMADHKAKVETKFPESDDLEFPTIEELAAAPKPKPLESASSKLIPLDNLKTDVFEIEHGINSVEETDISKLQEAIADEVEEDLWKVDEFEELKKEVSSKMEEVKNNFQPSLNDFDESLFKPAEDTDSIKFDESLKWNINETKDSPREEKSSLAVKPVPNMDELRAEMDEMIKKHVREYMDEMFKKNVEKISWEVIPDLAENLIRQELSKISNKLLDESK